MHNAQTSTVKITEAFKDHDKGLIMDHKYGWSQAVKKKTPA